LLLNFISNFEIFLFLFDGFVFSLIWFRLALLGFL